MKRETFKHIEAELYSYHDTLKEIDRLREGIMHIYRPTSDENIGSKGSNKIISVTEIKATQLVNNAHLQSCEKIIEAIDNTYNECDPISQRLIKLRYWTKPKLTWDQLEVRMECLSKKTAQRYRNKIVERIGDRMGWR